MGKQDAILQISGVCALIAASDHRGAKRLQEQKKKQIIQNWAKDLNRHFSKEDIQMVDKAHEKMLNTINH